jgi:hypothetical protein
MFRPSSINSTPAASRARCHLFTVESFGIAAASVLPTTAAAMAEITPTEEFHEIVRVAATTWILWDQSLTLEWASRE